MIRFTRHARIRLKEREISVSIAKEIITNPERIEFLGNDVFAYYGKNNGVTLKIVLIKHGHKIKIITLYHI